MFENQEINENEQRIARALKALTQIKFDSLEEAQHHYQQKVQGLVEQGIAESVAKQAAFLGISVEFCLDKLGMGVAGAGVVVAKKHPLLGSSIAVTGAALYAFSPEIGETTTESSAAILAKMTHTDADRLWALGHYYSWHVPDTVIFAKDRADFYHSVMCDDSIQLGESESFNLALANHGPDLSPYNPQQRRVLQAMLYADFMDAKELKHMQIPTSDVSVENKKIALNNILQQTKRDNYQVLDSLKTKIDLLPQEDKEAIVFSLEDDLMSKLKETSRILGESVDSINHIVQTNTPIGPEFVKQLNDSSSWLLSSTHAGFQLLSLLSPDHADKIKKMVSGSQQLMTSIRDFSASISPISIVSEISAPAKLLTIGNMALAFSGIIGATSALVSLFHSHQDRSQVQQMYLMLQQIQHAISRLDEKIQQQMIDISYKIGAIHYQSLVHFALSESRAWEDSQSLHAQIETVKKLLTQISVQQHQETLNEIRALQVNIKDLADARDYAEFMAIISEIEHIMRVKGDISVDEAISIEELCHYFDRLNKIIEVYRLNRSYLTSLSKTDSKDLPHAPLLLATIDSNTRFSYQNRVNLDAFSRLALDSSSQSTVPPIMLTKLLQSFRLLIDNYKRLPFHLPLRMHHRELIDAYIQEAQQWINRANYLKDEKILQRLLKQYADATKSYALRVKTQMADVLQSEKNARQQTLAHPKSSKNVLRTLFVKQCQKYIPPYIPENWFQTYAEGDQAHGLIDMSDAKIKRQGIIRIFEALQDNINKLYLNDLSYFYFMQGEVEDSIFILPVPLHIIKALPTWILNLETAQLGSLIFTYEWLAVKGEFIIYLGFEPLDKVLSKDSVQIMSWTFSGLPHFEFVSKNHARFHLWSLFHGTKFFINDMSQREEGTTERKEATSILGFKGSPKRYYTQHHYFLPDDRSLKNFSGLMHQDNDYPLVQSSISTNLENYEQEYETHVIKSALSEINDRDLDNLVASIHAIAGYFLDSKDAETISYILRLSRLSDSKTMLIKLMRGELNLDEWEMALEKEIFTIGALCIQGNLLFSSVQSLVELKDELTKANDSLAKLEIEFPSHIHERDMPSTCKEVSAIQDRRVLNYVIARDPEMAAKCMSLVQVLQIAPSDEMKNAEWVTFANLFKKTLEHRIFTTYELVALNMLGIAPTDASISMRLLPQPSNAVAMIQTSAASSLPIWIFNDNTEIEKYLRVINIYPHPVTQAWVYVVAGFYDGIEIVRAHFYGELGYCRLNNRSNVMEYNDPFNILDFGVPSSICASLPPTMLELMALDAGMGAIQGGVLGITENKLPKWQAWTIFYATYLGMNLGHKCYASQNEESLDMSRYLLEATIETGQAILCHLLFGVAGKVMEKVEKQLDKNQNTPAMKVISVASNVSRLGLFSYAMLTRPVIAISSCMAREITRRL